MSQARPPVVLLTLGRLPAALEIARACAAAGARVIIAEPWRWPLARLSRSVSRCYRTPAPVDDEAAYLASLLEIIDRECVTLVVPVSEETPFVAALHGRLPSGTRLICPTRERLLMLHDKWAFMLLAEQLGLPIPHSALADDVDALSRLQTRPRVVKPRLGCSGAGLVMLPASMTLPLDCRTSAYLVQETMPGDSCCSFSLVCEGKLIKTLVYRSMLDYGSVAVNFQRVDTPPDIADTLRTLAAATSHSGMLALDFMQDTQGQWRVIECNPRATSGVHFLSAVELWGALQNIAEFAVSPADRTSTSPEGEARLRRQEFWSSLTVLSGALWRGRSSARRWRQLFRTPDINWRWQDPLPFLLCSVVMSKVLWRSWRQGRPVVQLMTLDIGWYCKPPEGRR